MELAAGLRKRAGDRVFRERDVRAAGFARVDAVVDFVAIIYGSLRGGGEVEHTTAGRQEQLRVLVQYMRYRWARAAMAAAGVR